MKSQRNLSGCMLRFLVFLWTGCLIQFCWLCRIPLWVKIPLCILSGITYLALHFVRFSNGSGEKRLRTLAHGCSLLCTCFFWAIAEIPVLIATAVTSAFPLAIRICSAALFLLLCCLSFWISILHLLYSGKQVKKYWYLILCFIWWMPVVSWILTLYIYRTSKREWRVEQAKSACNAVRKESEICQTKYPILLVHGIFFRDWQYFNYWGRIPGELLRNGAMLFYGRQQSAQSVQNSGRELAVQIQAVCKATGSPKVNLIAHSKGGLDCRCAIQDYGAAPYVASLTTINTPHYGCSFVDDLLQKVPFSLQKWIAARYNQTFSKLGDANPDFLAGIQDLTTANCAAFLESHPCLPSITYYTVMSKMHSICAASFPLNLGYWMNRRREGDNDGLVPVCSAQLPGVPLLLVPETQKRGVSHGDMIDLMRENIPDFDVREWYVQLVSRLKQEGF